ncbi:MAG: hypothetical protein MJ088_06280, partial [Clostridia bacterium]|nr:hypothetical protein [Clostridia bacterium]
RGSSAGIKSSHSAAAAAAVVAFRTPRGGVRRFKSAAANKLSEKQGTMPLLFPFSPPKRLPFLPLKS